MDTEDEIHVRLLISKLEAQIELCEIERAGLKRILSSPARTASAQFKEAMRRSETLAQQSDTLSKDLAKLRSEFPNVVRK